MRALHNRVQKTIAECDSLSHPLDEGEYATTRPTDDRPTEAIAPFVYGRNGSCRFLCLQHHLMKTMGWFDVTLSEDGTRMRTSVDDGHLHMTEASGALAKYARSVFRIRADPRRATLREHNRLRLEQAGELREDLTAARNGEVPF